MGKGSASSTSTKPSAASSRAAVRAAWNGDGDASTKSMRPWTAASVSGSAMPATVGARHRPSARWPPSKRGAQRLVGRDHGTGALRTPLRPAASELRRAWLSARLGDGQGPTRLRASFPINAQDASAREVTKLRARMGEPDRAQPERLSKRRIVAITTRAATNAASTIHHQALRPGASLSAGSVAQHTVFRVLSDARCAERAARAHTEGPRGCSPRGPSRVLRVMRWSSGHLVILVTRPAPTVRPPSRIAKRRPSSMAIDWMSSTDISVLSPGMTISVPSGSLTTPVTSVVRK